MSYTRPLPFPTTSGSAWQQSGTTSSVSNCWSWQAGITSSHLSPMPPISNARNGQRVSPSTSEGKRSSARGAFILTKANFCRSRQVRRRASIRRDQPQTRAALQTSLPLQQSQPIDQMNPFAARPILGGRRKKAGGDEIAFIGQGAAHRSRKLLQFWRTNRMSRGIAFTLHQRYWFTGHVPMSPRAAQKQINSTIATARRIVHVIALQRKKLADVAFKHQGIERLQILKGSALVIVARQISTARMTPVQSGRRQAKGPIEEAAHSHHEQGQHAYPESSHDQRMLLNPAESLPDQPGEQRQRQHTEHP